MGKGLLVSPRVLLSFSHESADHEVRCLALADRLRSDGVDCMIDLYDSSPHEGWPRWMEPWWEWQDVAGSGAGAPARARV